MTKGCRLPEMLVAWNPSHWISTKLKQQQQSRVSKDVLEDRICCVSKTLLCLLSNIWELLIRPAKINAFCSLLSDHKLCKSPENRIVSHFNFRKKVQSKEKRFIIIRVTEIELTIAVIPVSLHKTAHDIHNMVIIMLSHFLKTFLE